MGHGITLEHIGGLRLEYVRVQRVSNRFFNYEGFLASDLTLPELCS